MVCASGMLMTRGDGDRTSLRQSVVFGRVVVPQRRYDVVVIVVAVDRVDVRLGHHHAEHDVAVLDAAISRTHGFQSDQIFR